MAPTREAWATAFTAQGRSDWEVYRLLEQRPELPPCHALHYLQMASEKIAKAYRRRDTSASLDDLLYAHVGFERFINAFLLSPTIKQEYAGRGSQLREILKTARLLARAGAAGRAAAAGDLPGAFPIPGHAEDGGMLPVEEGSA